MEIRCTSWRVFEIVWAVKVVWLVTSTHSTGIKLNIDCAVCIALYCIVLLLSDCIIVQYNMQYSTEYNPQYSAQSTFSLIRVL